MIVGTFFAGDEDTDLMRKQHDVYGDVLNILITTCNRLARFAIVLLNDNEHDNWGQIGNCDHRTLQGAHDLLAAAWRFNNYSRQGMLSFSRTANTAPVEMLWLDWLREEISAWIDHPHLVRSVQLILANQNQQIVYAAESRLCLGIMDRFGAIPWNRDLHQAYEKDIAEDAAAIPGIDSPATSSARSQEACS